MTILLHLNHKFRRVRRANRIRSTRPGLVVRIFNANKGELLLPIVIKWQYKKFLAISMNILGFMMTFGSSLSLVLVIVHHNARFSIICLVSFFLLAGIGIFYGGLYALLYCKKIEIGNQELIIETTKFMFKKEIKHEPINNYIGLLCDVEQRDYSTTRTMYEYLYNIYIIKLQHKNMQSNLVLYQSTNKREVFNLLPQFCRMLKLPELSTS